MLGFIILISVLLTVKKWLPPLVLFIGAIVFLPVVPFIIANNIKIDKPKTAFALRFIWILNFAVLTLIFLIS